MINLLQSQTLKFKLTEAHTTSALNAFISGRKFTSSAVTPVNTIIASNGTSYVTLYDGLSSGEQAEIHKVNIYNSDTATKTVIIEINNGTSDFVLFKCSLASGETLEYKDGWRVFANSGAVKQSINQGANSITSGLTAVVLASDVTNNNGTANTMQDVTGLGFHVLSGKTYYFRFIIRYTAAATTTGSRWGVNCSAGTAANLSLTSEYTLTTTTSTRNAEIQAFDSPASCNATSGVAINKAVIEGTFTPTADGNFIARFASEVSSSAIVAKAGSVCYYQQLN